MNEFFRAHQLAGTNTFLIHSKGHFCKRLLMKT